MSLVDRIDPAALRAWVRSRRIVMGLYRRLPPGLRHRVWRFLAERAMRPYSFPALPRAAAPAPWPAPQTVAHFGDVGVNLFGYFRGEFGLAESARSYARALIEAGVPVAMNDVNIDLPHAFGAFGVERHLVKDAPYPVSIVFVNPDHLEAALDAIGRDRIRHHHVVGCWFWELERVPREWLPAIEHVDGVLVASDFVREAFRQVTEKPVVKIPLSLPPVQDSGADRAAFGLDETSFIFLVTFDLHSWVERKNPWAALQAFRAAFAEGSEPVRLLIKTSNGLWHPEAFKSLVHAAAGDERIVIRNEVIDQSHVRALQRCCDVYVSLHRAEGFGLGLAECMAQGKPVIATGWSGNMEFMTAQNSCLVGYDLVDVPTGGYLHTEGQRWAQPRVDEAAAWMRRLFENRKVAQEIGQCAADDIRRALAPEATGRQMAQWLMSLGATAVREKPDTTRRALK